MKKFLIKFILLILVLAVGFFAFAYYASFGEGVRTGNLIKLSHKGYVVKTWEGALDVGVFQGAVLYPFFSSTLFFFSFVSTILSPCFSVRETVE